MREELLTFDTGQKRPYELEITRHEVPMRGLPEALCGFTFVHLTDWHGGFGNTGAIHEEAIRRVQEWEPDVVLLTGDYIDDHKTAKNHPMHETLSRLSARLGVWGCFGNHDHRRGVVGSRRLLERSGVRALENESVELEGGLRLAGLDDLYEGKPDIPRTLAELPPDRTSIVLSHNPSLLDRVPDRDVLILSGHTHGAQFRLRFPTPYMVVRFHLHCKQVDGWYTNGRARLYVNRGLGVTGRPFRINCPAEIAVFRLVPDAAERPRSASAPAAAAR